MYLGIDLGTGSVKLLLVTRDGTQFRASRGYPVEAQAPGWAETDPGDWVEAVRQAIRELPPLDGLRAVGLSGQMHGIVPVAGAGAQPLAKAILWADQRSAAWLPRLDGQPEAMARRGLNAPAAGMAAATLLWLQDQRPRLLQDAEQVLFPKDYLRAALTGDRATDFSDASGSLLYDFQGRAWDGELVRWLGLDPRLLPEIRQATAPGGTVTDQAARVFGLPAGVPVATGAADGPAGMYGTGLTDPAEVQVSIGTGAQVARPIPADRLPPLERSLNVFEGVEAGHRYRVAAMLNAGIALEWTLRLLRLDWDGVYRALQARGLGQRPDLMFLPYLSGERTPHMDPAARGAWTGLGLHHGAEDLMLAALLGVACSVRLGLETLGTRGVARVRAVGGSLRHPYWRELVSSVLGRDLELSRRTDASALGATRIAATAIGEAGAWEAALAGSGTEGTERVSGACLPWIDDYFEAFQEGYRRLAPQRASNTEQIKVH
jgi:xylulokinase